MKRISRKAQVRIPERDFLQSDDWQPDFMDPGKKAKDTTAVSRIQGYNHGDLFGQVIAGSGVTLNGQPVKVLACTSRGQAHDLLDHTDIVERVNRFEVVDDAPLVNLDAIMFR